MRLEGTGKALVLVHVPIDEGGRAVKVKELFSMLKNFEADREVRVLYGGEVLVLTRVASVKEGAALLYAVSLKPEVPKDG